MKNNPDTTSILPGLIQSLKTDDFFIHKKVTRKEVLTLALQIKETCRSFSADDHILLYTEDRSLIAAALISAMMKGPRFIFPPALSANSVKEIADTIDIKCILSDDEPSESLPDNFPVIKKSALAGKKPGDWNDSRSMDSPFISLFTGGSTGRPQVWQKTADNIFSETRALVDQYHINGDDIILSSVPPYHIYGFLFSVCIPLLSSAPVMEGQCIFPGEIIETFKNESPTVFIGIPVIYHSFRKKDFTLPSLRLAFSSAGMLDEKDERHFSTQTNRGIHEIYGSTETGGIAFRCRKKGEDTWTPFKGIAWKMTGERLHVSSRFLSSSLPLSKDGYYKTGDNIEALPDNRFILLGRADGITKIGGKRIDSLNVQNKIKEIEGIHDAFIIIAKSTGGREHELHGIIETDFSDTEVKQKLNSILETFEIPRKIKTVQTIPRFKTGKYDRTKILEILNQPLNRGKK